MDQPSHQLSMTVLMTPDTAKEIRTRNVRHVNSCFFTMVAVDDNRKPVAVLTLAAAVRRRAPPPRRRGFAQGNAAGDGEEVWGVEGDQPTVLTPSPVSIATRAEEQKQAAGAPRGQK